MLGYFCAFVVFSLAMLCLRWLVLGDPATTEEEENRRFPW
jgi:hypothetical protein